MKNCELCGKPFRWTWTDTHGVGQCISCGTPYIIWHYDENDKRIDAPPKIHIKEEYLDGIRKYHVETGRKIPSGCSFSYDHGYEVASKEEGQLFYEWLTEFDKSIAKPENPS
jgi:hypothetical protein